MIEKAISLGNLSVANYMATRSEIIDFISNMDNHQLYLYFHGESSCSLIKKAKKVSSLITEYIDIVQKENSDLHICDVVAKLHAATGNYRQYFEDIKASLRVA